MSKSLTPQESKCFDVLRDKLARFPKDGPFEQREASLDSMRQLAEQLVASFTARGLGSPHSKQLIVNRRTDNKHPFYHNYHAIEDVVRFASAMLVQAGGNDAEKDD